MRKVHTHMHKHAQAHARTRTHARTLTAQRVGRAAERARAPCLRVLDLAGFGDWPLSTHVCKGATVCLHNKRPEGACFLSSSLLPMNMAAGQKRLGSAPDLAVLADHEHVGRTSGEGFTRLLVLSAHRPCCTCADSCRAQLSFGISAKRTGDAEVCSCAWWSACVLQGGRPASGPCTSARHVGYKHAGSVGGARSRC